MLNGSEVTADDCPGHEYKADLKENGQPFFKHRRFASMPLVRTHCVHCKQQRFMMVNEWAEADKAET